MQLSFFRCVDLFTRLLISVFICPRVDVTVLLQQGQRRFLSVVVDVYPIVQ